MTPELRITIASSALQKSVYTKLLKIVYRLAHTLVNLDFGFFDATTNKRRIFWKCVTVIRSIIIGCGCFFTVDTPTVLYQIWFTFYEIRYILFVIILVMFKPNANVYKFYNHMELLDEKLQVNNAAYSFDKQIFFGIILNFAFRFFVSYLYCILESACITPVVSGHIFMLLVSSLDIIFILCNFVFYALSYRLEKLVFILEGSQSDFFSLQVLYQTIINLADLYKTAFNPVFISSLLFYVPAVMMTLYQALDQIFQADNQISLRYRTEYVMALQSLFVIILPAIFVDMLSTQAEKLEIILHHKLMEHQDDEHTYEIERFIRYIEAHPCRYSLCREVFPLNTNLLKVILNFCATYLIVILQFAHQKK